LPTLAAEPAAPSCARDAIAADQIGGLPSEALEADQRLLYDVSRLAVGPIELRYRTGAELYVTETADLADAELPEIVDRTEGMKRLREHEGRAEGPRVMELLTLRPDVARRLLRLAEAGEKITVEIVSGESTVDTLSLRQLLDGSEKLRHANAVPVVLLSEVEGPGAFFEPVLDPRAGEDCGYCDSTVPCDAVGPYDPGKGDCVTCWEIGDCDPGPCDCETVLQEYWGSWYLTNYVPQYSYACVDWTFSPDERALLLLATYRRDRIRLSRICPNCPACTNCYNQQQVINYQVQQIYCYGSLGQSCQPWDPTISPSNLCP
jgi:hypothetical protein